MARKARKKRTKQKKTETDLTLADYQITGEKAAYWQGVVMMLLPFVIAAVMAGVYVFSEAASSYSSGLHGKWWIPLEIIGYPLLCIPVLNWLAVRPRRQELKEAGNQARVMTKTHPELKAMLSEQARLLGITEPEMYVVEDNAAYAWAMPGKPPVVLMSKPMLEVLNGPETAAIMARQMGHIKSHHVKMAQAMTYYRLANPVWKLLLFPAGILMWGLRTWMDLIDYTADRVAVLITGRPAVVNAALAKLAVAADPNADVTPEELETYMNAATDLATDGEQMQLHYKVGTFLGNQRNLKERIEQVTEFLKLEQGQKAMEKMMQLKEKTA
ncbi:MAG: M48 family metalloprotease [Armatimonadetes bacterium]|nr:M48 family metalloprotease [Armatimonadota bacterium]